MKTKAFVFATLLMGAAAWAEKAPEDRHGPPPFTEIDANGDGSVSLGEFTEAQQKQIEKRFRFMDSNNDGKLSQGEMESGRERMKKRFTEGREGEPSDAK